MTKKSFDVKLTSKDFWSKKAIDEFFSSNKMKNIDVKKMTWKTNLTSSNLKKKLTLKVYFVSKPSEPVSSFLAS